MVEAAAWLFPGASSRSNSLTRSSVVTLCGEGKRRAAWDFTAAVALSSLSSCEEEVAAGRVVLMRNDGGRPDALLLELMCSGG